MTPELGEEMTEEPVCKATSDRWLCTLPLGHSGRHEAWSETMPIDKPFHSWRDDCAHDHREKLAEWMIHHGMATGHGDTHADLLVEAGGFVEDRAGDIAQLRMRISDQEETEDRLRDSLDRLRDSLNEWLKANSPGGWIDELRATIKRYELRLLCVLTAHGAEDLAIRQAIAHKEKP